jgi:Ca-activated chloride channel family protein
MLTVKLRFKQPDGDVSVKREFPLTDAGASYERASPDFKFAASVAAFALILKKSPYAGNASLEGVLELASEGLSFDPSGYRKEFLDLVAKAIALHLDK